MSSTRLETGNNVFDEAVMRLYKLYSEGHRLVVSFSAGKDSGVSLEIAITAATMADRLPVDVVMRDEEIMFPGTFEYAERVAARDEVSFTWLVANQPIINAFNRVNPYFWVFDPMLKPEEWVRQPPDWATYIEEKNINQMTIPKRFPPDKGKNLYAVVGMRVAESMGRFYGVRSMKGYITKKNPYDVSNVWPIYDMQDSDIWKCISDNKWDYNSAYDVMNRSGVSRNRLRIAPPTMSAASASTLSMAASAWPKWFEAVAIRLPGVRSVAKFGNKAVNPSRRSSESWEDCFQRLCVDDAPDWISERSKIASEKLLTTHSRHSTAPFPEVKPCRTCKGSLGSWKAITMAMYLGDPFSMKMGSSLKYVEPEFFRKGTGNWEGSPTFS